MPEVWGLSVWLEVEGKRLDEFGLEHDEGTKTVTCWVPCQTDKEFRFGVHANEPAPRALRYRIGLCLDGKEIKSASALPNRTIKRSQACTAKRPIYFEGQQEDLGLRPFRFAPLRLTDDDSHVADVSKLGDAVVIISTYEGIESESVPKVTRRVTAKTAAPISLGDALVHETTKRGLTSCIQFGKLRGQPRPRRCTEQTTKPLAIGLEELGRIIFKYRQMGSFISLTHFGVAAKYILDTLVADGIAPKPASAATQNRRRRAPPSNLRSKAAAPQLALNAKENIVDLSPNNEDRDEAELQRLRRRLERLREIHNLEDEIRALESRKRPHNSEELSNAAKRVKKEEVKAELFPPGVIDLT